MTQLHNSIELNKLGCKAKSAKCYNFSKVSSPIIFLRDTHAKVLSIEQADGEQSNLFKELSDISKT